MLRRNPIMATDSYKACHPTMYPAGFDGSFAYLESRGGFDRTVFFGLQAFVKDYLMEPVTMADVDEAEAFFTAHGTPFPRAGWERVVNVHKGYLPVMVRGIPEGAVVPAHNALLTVESTDREIPWITNWLETSILRAIWYPTTVCTNSWRVKKGLLPLMRKTCDDPENEIATKVSDFGARGVSSGESAALGGAAHLVNFNRTATVEAVRLANFYYAPKSGMAAKAIPSAEHSVILAWGQDKEVEAYEHILRGFARPGAAISIVSDSYDYWATVKDVWCSPAMVERVKASGGFVAVRPDSGDPEGTVVRTFMYLAKAYGTTKNTKGYEVLNGVRIVWGDGLTPETLLKLAASCEQCGISLTNIFFGMGGGLLQQVHRDQGKFAYKVSEVSVNGEWRPVAKTVLTDKAKASKAGRLALIHAPGASYETVMGEDAGEDRDALVPYYRNGWLMNDDSLDAIRARATAALEG